MSAGFTPLVKPSARDTAQHRARAPQCAVDNPEQQRAASALLSSFPKLFPIPSVRSNSIFAPNERWQNKAKKDRPTTTQTDPAMVGHVSAAVLMQL